MSQPETVLYPLATRNWTVDAEVAAFHMVVPQAEEKSAWQAPSVDPLCAAECVCHQLPHGHTVVVGAGCVHARPCVHQRSIVSLKLQLTGIPHAAVNVLCLDVVHLAS